MTALSYIDREVMIDSIVNSMAKLEHYELLDWAQEVRRELLESTSDEDLVRQYTEGCEPA